MNQPNGFQRDEQGWFIVSAPGDDRDYGIDWTQLLASLPGLPVDQVASSSWTIPPGLTLGRTTVNVPVNVNTAWITSPTIGIFFVSNTIITTAGRDFTRGFRLIVAENI